MNRRELLQRTSLLIGGSLLGADSMLAKNINWDAMNEDGDSKGIGLFSKAQIKLMNEIADTILPTTGTPGAKAAKVGQFMAVVVSDCYEPEDSKAFITGLAELDANCKAKNGKTFLKCSSQQRHDYLVELDKKNRAAGKLAVNNGEGVTLEVDKDANAATKEVYTFFKKFKDLTLWGYFTSEIGCTQALRMVEIPGRFEGCAPYAKGDRAWGGY